MKVPTRMTELGQDDQIFLQRTEEDLPKQKKAFCEYCVMHYSLLTSVHIPCCTVQADKNITNF